MKNFALIGAAGYIAPRHLKAIKETGNRLVAALDPHDAVGILDQYFFDAAFFTEFERFDRMAEKLRRGPEEQRIHYVSICSPNYLHDAHIRFALRIGAHALCEKPLVCNPWNLEALEVLEQESGKRVHCVLQLRSHPVIRSLRESVARDRSTAKREITLTYVTARGPWYQRSWKGIEEKSGGLATNIGVHFFDMLLWIFGGAGIVEVHVSEPARLAGYLELERARVKWFLSTDIADLPREVRDQGRTTFRSIVIDGKELEFSDGFGDLHTAIYRETLAGRGFSIADAKPSINLVYGIRNAKAIGITETVHPFFRK